MNMIFSVTHRKTKTDMFSGYVERVIKMINIFIHFLLLIDKYRDIPHVRIYWHSFRAIVQGHLGQNHHGLRHLGPDSSAHFFTGTPRTTPIFQGPFLIVFFFKHIQIQIFTSQYHLIFFFYKSATRPFLCLYVR